MFSDMLFRIKVWDINNEDCIVCFAQDTCLIIDSEDMSLNQDAIDDFMAMTMEEVAVMHNFTGLDFGTCVGDERINIEETYAVLAAMFEYLQQDAGKNDPNVIKNFLHVLCVFCIYPGYAGWGMDDFGSTFHDNRFSEITAFMAAHRVLADMTHNFAASVRDRYKLTYLGNSFLLPVLDNPMLAILNAIKTMANTSRD